MVKKKKKEKKEVLYYSKPKIKKLQSSYKKAGSPRAVQQVQKLFNRQEVNYENQKGKITYGSVPSKYTTKINNIENRTNKIVSSAIKRIMKKRLLKKPTAKLPSHSPNRFVANSVSPNALVREVPDNYENPTQDNRSLFFKQNYEYERRKRFGGFL